MRIKAIIKQFIFVLILTGERGFDWKTLWEESSAEISRT